MGLVLSSCQGNPTGQGFEVRDVTVRQSARRIDVNVSQNVKLGSPARTALSNGVPLVVRIDTEVRDSRSLTLLSTQQNRMEIRYLPLSERYQLRDNLEDPETGRTFPRLRHVIAELRRLKLSMPTGPLAPGDYEFRIRIRIDRSSLPMPIQLPSVLMREWRHDSNWSQWPFKVSA